MTIIVGADIGKYQTRIVDGPMTMLNFPSRIIRYNDSSIFHDLGKKDFMIEYKNESFFIGEFAKREGKVHIQYRDTSKVHFTTLLNLLCGLYCLPDDRYKIVINTPIGNKGSKEVNNLKELVAGKHNVTINGKKRTIYIEDVGVWVEGAAGFFSQPMEGIIQGFDFGSTTTNKFYFEDKYFINSKSDTTPYGIENSNEIVDSPEEFMEALNAQQSHIFKRDNKTMVMGGGSDLMIEHVKKFYPKAFIVNDPIFATAIGLYRLAKNKYV